METIEIPSTSRCSAVCSDILVLGEAFTRQCDSAKDSGFVTIYVDGGDNLENLKPLDDRWKVRLIEEVFHHLMFGREAA